MMLLQYVLPWAIRVLRVDVKTAVAKQARPPAIDWSNRKEGSKWRPGKYDDRHGVIIYIRYLVSSSSFRIALLYRIVSEPSVMLAHFLLPTISPAENGKVSDSVEAKTRFCSKLVKARRRRQIVEEE